MEMRLPLLCALVTLATGMDMSTEMDAMSSMDISALITDDQGTNGKVRLTTAADPLGVQDEYIVTLKNGLRENQIQNHMMSASSTLSTFSIARDGGSNGCTVGDVIQIGRKKFYQAHCTRGGIEELRKDTQAIAKIEQDQRVWAFECQSYDIDSTLWGLDRLDQETPTQDSVMSVPGSGTGVDVYIIDTGIDVTHADFIGRATQGWTSFGGHQDVHGHGTHVAGTAGGFIHGVAFDANLIAVRVLDDNGFGSDSSVIKGIEYAYKNRNVSRPAVINMSLGGGRSDALDAAVNAAVAAGVVVVVAAGNSNANACKFSPARARNAITVGSTDPNDRRSSFSNKGKCLDIFAPGRDILSTIPSNRTATFSGTSMASPHVAGMAAVYLGNNPNATPQEVTQWLIDTSLKGIVRKKGRRSPNRLLNSGCRYEK